MQDPSSVRPQSKSAVNFMKFSLWYWITVSLTLVSSIVIFIAPNLPSLVFLRYILASIFVLFLPGHALLRALFPLSAPMSSKRRRMGVAFRFGFSVVLSIAIVSVLGLILDYTYWGINLGTLVLGLSSLTVMFSTIALLRERRNLNQLGQAEIEPERSS
jgi:uncharacterized membrane protein